ncbi:MAG: cytochrome c3 family protein [Methanocellales archaeon]|nr:cytochrome c3 family protein [Methanocellales archaeon]
MDETCNQCHLNIICSDCHDPANVPHGSHGTPAGVPIVYTCENCHEAVHNMTEIHQSSLTPDCLSCHDNDLTIEHENRGYNCSTCHASMDPTVQNAISTKNTACDACHVIHGDIEAVHVSTTGDCIYCHNSNLMVTHNDNCALCHENPSVTPTTADCYSCHPSMPHDYSCQLCHGSKYDPAYYSSRYASMHKKHDDKALCGDCHAIPASTTLEPSGEYCAICHGSPERYDPNKVYSDVHMKHAKKDIGESGDFCYWCHGLDVPDITPITSCNNCHSGKSYDGDSRRIHEKHGDEITCVGCHDQDEVLNVNPKEQCYICHRYKDYSSTYRLHDKHMGKGWCDSCHGSNIPVDQYDLSRARTGERDVRILIEDNHNNRYEVRTKIYIKW